MVTWVRVTEIVEKIGIIMAIARVRVLKLMGIHRPDVLK